MKRIEIIANLSVQEDLVMKLEEAVSCFQYTVLPVVHGRGLSDRKLGTTVWPEENFVLFSYLEESDADKALGAVAEVKVRYPREGIKVFVLTAG